MVRLRGIVGQQHLAKELLQVWGQRDNTEAYLNSLSVLFQPVINLRHREGRLGLLYAVTGEQRRGLR